MSISLKDELLLDILSDLVILAGRDDVESADDIRRKINTFRDVIGTPVKRMVPDGKGGTREATGPNDYESIPL